MMAARCFRPAEQAERVNTLSRFNALAFCGWLLLVLMMVGALHTAREWVLDRFSSQEAHQQWGEWVEAAKQQASGNGPVQRRVPKSADPPVLLLMRDYYGTCLGMSLFLSTCLYGTFVWLLRGASTAKRSERPG